VTSASEIPPATADNPVALVLSMPLNALMMRPRCRTIRRKRCRADGGEARKAALHFRVHDGDGAIEARLAASITSISATCEDADWNSEQARATTLAMWLFLCARR